MPMKNRYKPRRWSDSTMSGALVAKTDSYNVVKRKKGI